MTLERAIELANIAAEKLSGTCNSIANLGEEFEEAFNDRKEFGNRLDELIFECQCCNWWCEINEMSDKSDEWVCVKCENES